LNCFYSVPEIPIVALMFIYKNVCLAIPWSILPVNHSCRRLFAENSGKSNAIQSKWSFGVVVPVGLSSWLYFIDIFHLCDPKCLKIDIMKIKDTLCIALSSLYRASLVTYTLQAPTSYYIYVWMQCAFFKIMCMLPSIGHFVANVSYFEP